MKFLNKIILSLIVLLSLASCTNTKEETYYGHLLDSDAMVFISEFKLTINNHALKITYPKYDCLNNPYNKKNFDSETLKYECGIQDDFFDELIKIYPKKECTDRYEIIQGTKKIKYNLVNKSNPCYGFSKNLTNIYNKDKYAILQFYHKNGHFQAVFNK
jgi:hypothetical protein